MKNKNLLLYVTFALAAICSCRGPEASLDSLTVRAPDTAQWIETQNRALDLTIEASASVPCKASIRLDIIRDTTLMGTRDTIISLTKNLKIAAKDSTKSKTFKISGLEPGFYRAAVSAVPLKQGEAKETAASERSLEFNIGYKPELIRYPQTRPEDFDAFWDATLAELKNIPIEASMALIEDNGASRLYEVRMKSFGGEEMGGLYSEPVAEGKYPVYVEYMGYGAEVYHYGQTPDCIRFLVSTRGQGIFKPGQSEDWFERGMADPDNYYYRGAYCDVVRAIDFICTREKADTSLIFARGESQGGALTWIAASLDSRLAAIAPAVPFLSDFPEYGKIVRWPMHEAFDIAKEQGLPKEQFLKTLRYFDVMNFTDRITCPVYMAFGLQDPTCPPRTNFAGYNRVKSDKKWYCVPTCGHAIWEEESWDALRAEFFKSIAESARK